MIALVIAPDRTKFSITKLVDGRPVASDRFEPKSARARLPVTRTFGVTDEWLLEAVEAARVAAAPVTFPVADPLADAGVGSFLIRPIDQTDTGPDARTVKADPAAFLRDELPGIPVNWIAKWSEPETLCCLDIDYHTIKAPSRDWLTSVMMTRVSPQPAAWHFSRSGGVHAFYKAIPPYAADELAAVAALRFRAVDASAGLELKTVVRGPGPDPIRYSAHDDDGGAVLGEWFAYEGVEEDDRDRWLDTHDMELGRRYSHDKCPIDPTPGYESKGEPVTISEGGVFCHRCESAGLSLGSRRAGFAPWAALLGAPASGDLGRMIRNIAHWGHARWILTQRYGMPEALARKAYKAALKTFHRDKPRAVLIESVFDPVLDNIARVNEQWFVLADSYALPRDATPIIGALPYCQTVDADGKVKTSPKLVSFMNNPIDHTDRGYASVEPIHGFKIAETLQGPISRVTRVVLPNKRLAREYPRFLPRYLPRTQRMPLEEAWAVIESVAPKIDRTFVTLALCAFGTGQETRLGMPPMTFVSGPSGTAKSSTLKIAAGIFGAFVGEAVFDRDNTRFRQSLHEAAVRGPAIVLNELLKDSARANGGRPDPKAALDVLLTLTPDSLYRANYRDPAPFGRVPSVWVTEPSCPGELQGELQLSRRLRYHPTSGTKDQWAGTIAKARLPDSDLQLIRAHGTVMARACDTILSDVADTFFATPMSWDEQAETLGVKTIEKSDFFLDSSGDLKHLFRLLCKAPEVTGRQAERLGRGWKQIRPNASEEEDELSAVYRFWADGLGENFKHSRRLEEKDWAKVLGVDEPVRLGLQDDGVNVYMRLYTGTVKRPLKINQEIRDPETLT